MLSTSHKMTTNNDAYVEDVNLAESHLWIAPHYSSDSKARVYESKAL